MNKFNDILPTILFTFFVVIVAHILPHHAFAANSITWKKMPGKATDISIGGGAVWILSTTTARGGYTVQRWNVASKKWETISGAAGQGIDVAPDGNAWVRSASNNGGGIYDGRTWRPGGGGGSRDFSVGDGVSYWAIEPHVNSDGNSRLMSYRRYRRQYILEEPAGIRLDVGVNGQVWYVKRDDTIGRYTGQLPTNNRLTQASDWSTVPGTAIDIAIGEGGTVWAIGKNKKPMKWTGSAWQKQSSSADLKVIAVDRTGLPWAIADNGDIYAASNSAALSPPPNPSLAILKRTKACKKCNLQNANLSGLDLRNARLDGAYLRGAHLKKTKLNGANLSGADLTIAKLGGANLTGANLQNATLAGVDLLRANLTGANFTGANLTGAKFVEPGGKMGATLSRTNFTRANLNSARLWAADMRKTTLTSANLSRASLVDANLSGMKLAGVNFTHAGLRKANLERATLTAANFESAFLNNARLNSISAVGANFTRATMKWVNMAGANVQKANFTGTRMTSSNVSGSKFQKATFSGAFFDKVDARNANFKKTKFGHTQLGGTSFDGATGDSGVCIAGSKGHCMCSRRISGNVTKFKCHPRM